MLSSFTRLTKDELGVVRKKLDRFSKSKGIASNFTGDVEKLNWTSSYELDDPFTVCVVNSNGNKFSGVAKRMRYAPRKDLQVESIGKNIALSRAVEKLLEHSCHVEA